MLYLDVCHFYLHQIIELRGIFAPHILLFNFSCVQAEQSPICYSVVLWPFDVHWDIIPSHSVSFIFTLGIYQDVNSEGTSDAVKFVPCTPGAWVVKSEWSCVNICPPCNEYFPPELYLLLSSEMFAWRLGWAGFEGCSHKLSKSQKTFYWKLKHCLVHELNF